MTQREVPGIDNAYLAIDTEEGMEAVWNEVMYSQRKTRLNHKVLERFCYDVPLTMLVLVYGVPYVKKVMM